MQKSNIYVTQQLSRLLAVQYRHELLALQRESFNTALRGANIPVAVNNSSVHERDKITTDLLNILKAIPLRSLGESLLRLKLNTAVNTLPLVLKVRYVAATLLETSQVSSTSSFGDETSLASQRKLCRLTVRSPLNDQGRFCRPSLTSRHCTLWNRPRKPNRNRPQSRRRFRQLFRARHIWPG